jgi:hypothetical protein
MNRFGYLLDEGPMNIDLKEVGNMMKANPKMFGAELVNMMMADPYLLFMPMGWSALGRGVVNSLRLKYSKAFTMTRQKPKLLKLAQQENVAKQSLANKIKEALPDALDSRRKVFYYITGAKVNRNTFEYDAKLKPIADSELNKTELNVAKQIEKIFKEYNSLLGKDGSALFNNQRSNYLPLMWDNYNPKDQPFRFIKKFDEDTIFTGPSTKFQFARRNVFEDVNKGLQKNYKIREGMDDPAELVRMYGFAASKALSTRGLITHLETFKVGGKPLMYRTIKTGMNADDFVVHYLQLTL